MKKTKIAAVFAVSLALFASACSATDLTVQDSKNGAAETATEAQKDDAKTEETTGADQTTEAATDGNADQSAAVEVMTHEQFIAAEIDTPVVVETYVQDKQSWWEDKASIYAQSEDGAYFLYNATCSEEMFDKLVPGTKIKVSGYKAEWSGEVEITDATLEILDGSFVAEPEDLTEVFGTEDLINHQNEYFVAKGFVVEPAGQDDAGNDLAFLYNWDNSGAPGDDIYFNVSYNGNTYSFTIESYLRGKDTDVYKTAESLQVGDVVDLEGFLYWYEGANPHTISITKQ